MTNLAINPLTLNLTNMGMEGSSGTAIASPGMNNGFNCQPETNCAEEYQYGSTVTLTVTPSDNSTFLGWVGGCKDSFTIKKNMNCKAVFDQANKLIDCSDNNITIETISSGDWNSATTWQRLAGNDLPNEPIKNDIVRINSLHTITSPFYAIKMKALCIKPEATLTSFDNQGTPLEIQANDYFENNGIVVGKAGANESDNVPCTNKNAVGTGACAMPGADVIVKVGKSRNQEGNGGWKSYYSGGPILNTGQIIAGKGGDASFLGAPGGNATVLGRNITNQGTIQAGHGGNILGTRMGESGRGGSTQIRGNLGGYGNLYNQNGAQALAGNGGNCNSDPTTFGQRSGQGGDLQLVSIPKVHLNGGIQRTGSDGANCPPKQPDGIWRWPNLWAEPSIIDLSGANTTVTGGNIAIYGGEDWVLDLSNLNGTVVDATGNITLAVGDGGVIDLRGSKGTILKAADQVQIFADEILVDDNVNPSDLIQANHVAIDSSKILREVSLIGANKLRWEPEVILPVNLTLANNGPEADTYALNVTDSASWVLSQLPPTIEVEGLEAIDLVLNVTPPATRGETDTITVVATSQSDPNITATAHVQILINPEPMTIPQPFDDSDATPPAIGDDSPSEPSTTTPPSEPSTTTPPDETSPSTSPDETSIPIPTMNGEDENKEEESSIDIITLEGTIVVPIPSTTPQCPSTGEINWLCINNREQILTDVTIEKEGIIAGGMLAGTINNQGLISRVKIQPNTTVSGGKLTGYIQNEGTLANFAFVGAQVSGGTLAGIITNDSRVGGIFINVHLAADTHITGGNLQGEITGEAAEPALLEELTVKANSHLAFVTIGKNVQLENQVTFGDGVQFVNADEDPRTVEVIATDSKPTTISQNMEVVTTCHTELPQLGAMATDSQGKTVATRAQLAGGAAATSEIFQRELTVSLSTPVDIRATLCVDPNQVGQLAGFIVYVAYTAADSPNRKSALYRLDVNNQVLPWDGNFASLLAFKEDILEPTQTVEIYQGKLVAPPGVIEIHLGYRLEEGSVTVSDKTIQITITN